MKQMKPIRSDTPSSLYSFLPMRPQLFFVYIRDTLICWIVLSERAALDGPLTAASTSDKSDVERHSL